MRQRRLGRTGLRVPEIGFGTMTFGSMADEATSLAILDKGVDVADGAVVGVDVEADRTRFTVSRNGVVVVGKNRQVERA